MKPIPDEELILYYYGEAQDGVEIERRMASSPELRSRLDAIRQVLDAVEERPIPDRADAYGSRTWHRIEPELERGPFSMVGEWRRPLRQWAWVATGLILLAVAFLTGRMLPRDSGTQMAGLTGDGRERILLMTVAGHLERSEMLLLELVNIEENGEVDLSVERQLAGELGRESRFYRQAAEHAGKSDVVALLQQLETVLVELSNGPQTVASADLGELRVRLDEGDVLFRVRVLGSRLRQEVRTEIGTEDTGPRARDI